MEGAKKPPGARIWSYLSHHHLELSEIVLSLIIIWLIIIEVLMAKEAEVAQQRQLELLKSTLSTTERQAENLGAIVRGQQDQVESLSKMNELLQRQLGILSAEEKRRLLELSMKPSFSVAVGGESVLSPGATKALSAKELTSTHALFEVDLWNLGTAAAHAVTFRIGTTKPGIRLSCQGCSQSMLPHGVTGAILIVEVANLRPRVQLPILLAIDFPTGTDQFDVWFSADSDGLSPTRLGAMTVRPPKSDMPDAGGRPD